MSDTADYGSGLGFGAQPDTSGPGNNGADVPPAPVQPSAGPTFGSSLHKMFSGPGYSAPDPAASALDQTADVLQQRIQRANTVATNPILQFFNPEGVAAARDFVPKATEALQKIRSQKADMQAARTQAETLGLAPGEVSDEASVADRVVMAQSKALKGDLRVFKGLQAVDPKAAEAIQDQVHEAVAGHLTKAQLAFDSLAGMQNQGQYTAKLNQLRRDGTLTDLEALGLKVPPGFDAFNAAKAREGQALREARIGVDTVRQRLEERNTYQPMEEKEAKTYNGRLTTVYGDQVTNGTWARNGAAGTRGLVVNGAADPRDLGTKFTLATPEQRKAIKEEFDAAVPKEELHKYREFDRTYELATKDAKGKPMPDGKINTNPNVQQGVAEGLASMLRGGSGGANVGLLKIELAKRGWAQSTIDSLVSNYAGVMNTMFANADKPYLSGQTQKQIRDVMDVLKTYNDDLMDDRTAAIAKRAGALGLNSSAFGFGKQESAGVVSNAIEAGRREQIERMMPNHQAIGGGDGVIQLSAQRPGVNAVQPPAGAAPATTQLPGAQPLTTPVQQARQPAGASGPPAVTGAPPPSGSSVPAGGSAPVTVAGQSVAVPLPQGASPGYAQAVQRIETGNEKDPWRAGAKGTTASGAFQFIKSTWAADKPPGAPDKAADASPQQQAEAFATHTARNAQSLAAAKLPVNDTTLYVAHNLGAGGASSLLSSSPTADARSVVGEDAARNNPMFFRGRPTVATVLDRYQKAVTGQESTEPPSSVKPLPGSEVAGGASGGGLLQRISRTLMQGVPEDQRDKAAADVGNAALEHAPAIASTLGAVAGSAAGPAGTVAGGAAGGGAGQALKDYLQGNAQSPAAIAKQTALGGVLGVGGAARPVLGAAMRAGGAGAVEAGAAAAGGENGSDVVDAGVKGAATAAGGEMFGRALGMAGHKVWNLFAPEAKQTVREAAAKFSAAEATLAKEPPKFPNATVGAANPAYELAIQTRAEAERTLKSAGLTPAEAINIHLGRPTELGAAVNRYVKSVETMQKEPPILPAGVNPKYLTAEADRLEAERVLKDAGLKPEEAAYAHKVSSEGVPRQEAEVARPGAVEKAQIGAGYQQLEREVGDRGTGAVKPTPKLPDGPRAAVEAKKVSAEHAELAERTEAAITAPAPNFQAKWVQLKDARSALLEAQRDALTSTAPGRSQTAKDMRALADTVRVQQEKVAKYVFGEKDGEAFISRLKVLDTRYHNLMEATNHGDIAKAAAMKGEAGRDADRKFRAFAHDDPAALAAWSAMRRTGANLEQGVHDLVAAERIPVLGKVFSAVKLAGSFKRWMTQRAAGSPVKFEDVLNAPADTSGRQVRDVLGTAAQRGAAM